MSNHDQPRHASRLAATVGATGDEQDAIARAAAVLILTARGTPFLYYGEEIGMGDTVIPPGESVDAAADYVADDYEWWDRSPARTPMPWASGVRSGFTTGVPWLRLGDDAAKRNVSAQAADPHSVLACYRRLLRARAGSPSLQMGTLRMARTGEPDVLAYRRGGDTLVLINMGASTVTVTVTAPRPTDRGATWRSLVGTEPEPASVDSEGSVRLAGYEGVVLTTQDR
jgi:alpha-glucosidase